MSEYRLIPLGGKRGEGKFAKVSPEDYPRVLKHSWCCGNKNYVLCWHNGTTLRLHRLILFGYDAPSRGGADHREVDHKDLDPLNNVRGNLRICNRSQNACNRKGFAGTSNYKGVAWHKNTNQWIAQIGSDGHYYHLGLYRSEVEAAKSYDAVARFLHGEFASINFPGDECYSPEQAKLRARQLKGKD